MWLVATTVLIAVLGVATWFVVTQPLHPAGSAQRGPAPHPARLAAHVRRLCVEFAPRDEAHPRNLARAASYIADEFASGGARVSTQAFTARGADYRNVIASFGPREGARIVVGAHYDAAGPLPGADDNASGVAGLIELGRLLGAGPVSMRVDLVAYTLEEPPWFRTEQMGSALHARALRDADVAVKLMIALEMIGYFSDGEGSQGFPLPLLGLFYPRRGNFITVIGDLAQMAVVRQVKAAMRGGSALPVHSFNGPRLVPGLDMSDHLNFWKAGYPALMVTDTAFYRNPNYHSATDTPDTLDYPRMAQVVQGVYAAVLTLTAQ